MKTIPQLLKALGDYEEKYEVDVKLVLFSDGCGAIVIDDENESEFDDIEELKQKLRCD